MIIIRYSLPLLLMGILVFADPAKSQNFYFKTFTTTEGLSSYNSNKIVQDHYGFIWIGTQEGINRFDGREFKIIKKYSDNRSSLNATYVTDCQIDKKGLLWVSTQYGGIDVIDPRNLAIVKRLNEHTQAGKGFISNWVRTQTWDSGGNLWFGTYYGLNIYMSHTDSLSSFTSNPFKTGTDLNINFIGSDNKKTIIAGIENEGILAFDINDSGNPVSIPKLDFGANVNTYFVLNNIYVLGDDNLLLATSQGLYVYHVKTKQVSAYNKQVATLLSNKDVRVIERDLNNDLWIGTDNGIYIVSAAGILLKHVVHDASIQNSILSDYINDIHRDSYGNIWITSSKGVNLLQREDYDFDVIRRDIRTGNTLEHSYTLSSFLDTMLIVSDKTGLYKVGLKDHGIERIISNDEYGIADGMYEYQPGQLLFSGLKKLGILSIKKGLIQSETASAVFPELKILEHHAFSSIRPVKDSIVLFGSIDESGLFLWDRKKKTVTNYTSSDGLPNNYIENIRIDSTDRIWLLGDLDVAIFDMQRKSFRRLNNSTGKPGDINSHFPLDLYDDGQTIWITTYGGGLYYTNRDSFYFRSLSEANGFNSNSAYCIIKENDSLLWISTNNGLVRLNKNTMDLLPFYYSDGLQSSSFDIRSGCKVGNSIFFGGMDGLTRITRRAGQNYGDTGNFPVYISNIEYYDNKLRKDTNDVSLNKITFSPGADLIIFHVSALSYLNRDRLSYQYRLKEGADDWLPVADNTITFSGFTHGTYHLTIRCKNSFGRWNYSNELVFIIQPRWYQTMAFKLMLLILSGILLFGIYRLRINQLKKEANIRSQLASDLHDDLGSTLNSVKVYSNLAMMEKENTSYLVSIKESTHDAIAGVRDLVWVLDDKKDTVQDLLLRINQFAVPLCNANQIDFVTDIDPALHYHKLEKKEKRNLYMIIKESVNNSIKYAACTKIEFSMRMHGSKMSVRITDNGKGFDTTRSSAGNGLSNIQNRAKELNYKSHIQSSPGNGTVILLEK